MTQPERYTMQRAVSIRAPREGGDMRWPLWVTLTIKFQSAPPARGAISEISIVSESMAVSIRAPREGGDDGG